MEAKKLIDILKKVNWSKLTVPTFTLIGIVIGGVMAGHYNTKNTENSISLETKKFKTEYSIEQNKRLVNYVETFIDQTMSFITLLDEKPMDQHEINKKHNELAATSLKIMAISSYRLGTKAIEVSQELSLLKKKRDNFRSDDANKAAKLIINWTISAWVELKGADYHVDFKAIDRDILKSQMQDTVDVFMELNK